MADGLFGVVRMEEAEAVLPDFVVGGVGEPAFEGVVVERYAGNEDLDLQVDGVGQVLDDGLDFPQLGVFVALDGVEVAVGGVLDPEWIQLR